LTADSSASRPHIVFDEDLVGNLLKASELAPQVCRGCSRYHLGAVARRAVRGSLGDLVDKPEITDHLIRLYREIAETRSGPIDLTVAGAADTGILAICANAAAAAGPTILARCHFAVLDRCPTPLTLCEEFGRRHDLRVTTQVHDVLADLQAPRADIVVAHSLFRFIPQSHHVSLVRTFLGWLNSGGRIVFSVGVGWRSQPDFTTFNDRLRRLVAEGGVRLAEPVESFLLRLAGPFDWRVGEFEDFDSVRRLFDDAGAKVEAIEEMVRGRENPTVQGIPKRTLAVLSKTS
jgi:hypothetical protein